MCRSVIPCEEKNNVVPNEEGKIRNFLLSNDSDSNYREGSIPL